MVLDLTAAWFDGLLESTHGAFSQIVLSDSRVLLQSDVGPNERVLFGARRPE